MLVYSIYTCAQRGTNNVHLECDLWIPNSMDAPGHQLAFADTSSEIQSIALSLAVLTSFFLVIVMGMNGLSDLIMGIVSGTECKKA